MKLKIILVSILTFFVMSQTLEAEEKSFVAQRDKQKHMAVSALFASAVTAFARNKGASKMESFFYGAGAAVALGLVKEGIDVNTDGNSEWADVGANAIGAAVGAIFSAQFEWKF
jgi:uncharacterized protein YfiM (DUF2279 family)